MKYWFNCFGLRVASDVDLCSWKVAPGSPDLVINVRRCRRELMPEPSVQWGRDAAASISWAVLPGLARVEAHDSGELLIEPAEGLDIDSLRSLVISTALPLALQSLPGLLLEGSAIRWQGQDLLILGRGYCGKSSLAALMADVGAELLADSHCFVRLNGDGHLVVSPALPHVRLWPAQARLLGPGWPDPKKLRPSLKKGLFVVPERFAVTTGGVHGMIILWRGIDDRFRQRRFELTESLQATASASNRLRVNANPALMTLRFNIMSRLTSLRLCHLIQWPRSGGAELETRSRLLELLANQGWGVGA